MNTRGYFVNKLDLCLTPLRRGQVWQRAVSELFPSPTDSLHLYLNQATLAALPGKCSRHNTPSRAHSVTRLVRSLLTGSDQTVVVSGDTRGGAGGLRVWWRWW